MKTIILCGGKGTRLNEETEFKPKPLVQVGGIPILLHIMNIYAHHGHKEFILALGYKGDMIKDYFLTLARYKDDIEFDMKTGNIKSFSKWKNYDYKIVFAETGLETTTGGRVLECMKYIPKDDKHFFVTYGDGVSTIDISKLYEFHKDQEKRHDVSATMTAVHPTSSFGRVTYNDSELVTTFQEKGEVFDDYVNGGFLVFNKDMEKEIKYDEMVFDTLTRITKDNKLAIYRHAGYWKCMDNMKHYIDLNSDWDREKPWAVWEK